MYLKINQDLNKLKNTITEKLRELIIPFNRKLMKIKRVFVKD
jgi:hypothetical protein